MTELVYALFIAAQLSDLPDQQVAVFQTRAQCLTEARAVIEQGPHAYCLPQNKPRDEMAVFRLFLNAFSEAMNRDAQGR